VPPAPAGQPDTGPGAAPGPVPPGPAETTADGDTIELAPGHYSDKFVASVQATAAAPITVVGSCASVLDGGPPASGYALYLVGANHWRLAGFTVTGAQKGIMGAALRPHRVVPPDRRQRRAGGRAPVQLLRDTGTVEPRFGEGLYLGSAESNWTTKSGGKPTCPTGTGRWATRSATPQRRTSTSRRPPAVG
jgi:hypothetical protein